jgi:hypothetical protein
VLFFLGAKSEVISRDISETGNKWKVQLEWLILSIDYFSWNI